MKYGDLVAFEPIETVVELRDANKLDRARQLVRTYVVSDAMGRQLAEVIASHLDFGHLDARGLFVVGNYGTGKSHLMAVVSALAENADLLPDLRHEGVRKAFAPVAGRYLVARVEIGAVKTPLRDIFVREIEKHLKAWGVDYRFPAVDQITNHKDAIEEMLVAVEATHPGKGVVIVVDELLDYLKALGQGAISAFNFLRELGEAAGNGRFRVIAGVQESLMSSPSFGFLSSLIQKVAARFVEVWITKDDLAYVVENRLLVKTPEQRNRIRAHLEAFTPLFPTMSARIDDFVRLYPIHPRYLEIFEEIEIAEKREVLRTLSQEMSRLLASDVPADQPGIVAYDSYWRVIRNTPSYLATPSVGEVEGRSSVVTSKVRASIAKKQYLPAAERIVDGLSVFRLAVGGIRRPIGLTPSNIRDDLALMLPVPEKDPEFLNTTIESVLKEIRLAVNGQFIARNDSGQYYLDVDRAIDYDVQVERKVAALEPVPDTFDRYYFDVLTRVLDVTTSPHVPGMQIWRYQLPWPGHGVTRPGYLFFGSPNERSTAQPPRTFYCYFLAHFAPTPFEDARRDDEVFFRLARPSSEVVSWIKRYAAANELAPTTSGEEKAQYLAIAEKARKDVAGWLTENVVTCFDVTSGGVTRGVSVALGEGVRGAGISTARDLVNAIASTALAPSFDRQFPGYPAFVGLPQPITEETRAQAATEGLRYVAALIKTEQGAAVVDGLQLRKDGSINPADSPYAADVLEVLGAKGQGQVVNRGELIAERDGVEVDARHGMEPEWLAVVLLALAYRGEIEITVGGQTIDPVNVAAGAGLGAEALGRFKTIQRPKATPIAALKELFDILALNPALLDADTDKAAVELQVALVREIEAALRATSNIGSLRIGGEQAWAPDDAEPLIQKVTSYKDALDRLTNLNSGGKLKLFKGTTADLARMRAARTDLRAVEARVAVITDLAKLGGYLADAKQVLRDDDPWQAQRTTAVERARAAVEGRDEAASAKRAMQTAKATFVEHYMQLHNDARLEMAGDEARKQTNAGATMKRATLLATVSVLAGSALTDLKKDLASLVMCRATDARELDDTAWCTACFYKPSIEVSVVDARRRVVDLDERLDRLNADWSSFLTKALEDPTAVQGLSLLDPSAADAVLKATDPSVVPAPETVSDLNRVLQGLQRVAIQASDLVAALQSGGPATAADLEARFAKVVNQATAGKNPATVRLVVE
jgi:Family of unknown function (DUF6079)